MTGRALICVLTGLMIGYWSNGICEENAGQKSYFSDGVVHIISSSHQDIGWMDSIQKCIEGRDINVITPALDRLRENPEFRFVMEDALCLIEYLERHPDRKEEIRQLTKSGRFEWGATYNQPYESLYSGEELIRETYLGRKLLRKMLPGCDSHVAWSPDVPGRSLQMPQILAKAGIKYLHMSRQEMGFYKWMSPDGSSILAYSPGHYYTLGEIFRKSIDHSASTNISQTNKDFEGVVSALTVKLNEFAGYYKQRSISPQFGVIASTDFSGPMNIDDLMNMWNKKASAGKDETGKLIAMPRLKYSTGEEFMDAVSSGNPSFDTIMGERPNVWLYIHGPTHHRAITAGREAARLLTAAEKFATVDALLSDSFNQYPSERLNRAWADAIYPDHGWGGNHGDLTDRQFRTKMESGRDAGREILNQSMESIAGRIMVKSTGIPVVVFNPLSWNRTEPVMCKLNVEGTPRTDFRLTDARGRELSYQVISPGDEEKPADEELMIVFVATDVPAIGYKTFYLDTLALPSSPIKAPNRESGVLENDFYRIELGAGGIKNIYDKQLKKSILRTDKFLGGELFTMQSVGNGAGEFAEVQQPTMEGFEKLSDYKPGWVYTESGPVRDVAETEQRINHCTIRERIVLYRTVKRIDCEVNILGWDGTRSREFRLAFPLDMPEAKVAYEVPMGVVEVGKGEIKGAAGERYKQLCSEVRPREVQDWFNASDGKTGITISSSVAVFDWADPTSNPAPYTILQPLLLASRKSCHSKGNWYLQAGDHSYRFSIYSHQGGWQEGYKSGMQSNQPLLAVIAPRTRKDASLPEEKGFCSVSSENTIISTIKKCEDDNNVIIRCYEIEGKDTNAEINWFAPVGKVELTNIIEEEGKSINYNGGAIQIRVGHSAIETVKLERKK